MAKKYDDFSKVYKAVQRNAKMAAILAAKNTAKKIAKDMYKEALDGLKYYYSQYDPDVYDRTYNLKNAIRPYYKDQSDNKTVSIEIGIVYDALYLEAYYSNSPRHKSGDKWISRDDDRFDWDGGNNGIPDPEWILDNFLRGIHPKTTKGYFYAPVTDPKSQIQIMNDFIDNKVQDLMDKYMDAALLREFTRRMS